MSEKKILTEEEQKKLNEQELNQPNGGGEIWFKPAEGDNLPPTAVWIGGSTQLPSNDGRIRDIDLGNRNTLR